MNASKPFYNLTLELASMRLLPFCGGCCKHTHTHRAPLALFFTSLNCYHIRDRYKM